MPYFLSAKFAEPVLLVNAKLSARVEPGGIFRSIMFGAVLWFFGRLDPALSAKYRALKRLAIQSDDHRNEQIFFRGELRARRYREDQPWHPAFWFGVLYEVTSNFGYSILLPVLWLIALNLMSSSFYLGQSVPTNVSPRAYFQALLLSDLPDSVHSAIPASRPTALPPLACKDGAGDPVTAAALLAIKKSLVFVPFDWRTRASKFTPAFTVSTPC